MQVWLGIDGGSTTVKLSVYDPVLDRVVLSRYERHDGEPRTRLSAMLRELPPEFRAAKAKPVFTGSQCRPLADLCSAPYVQEVISGSLAVRRSHPQVRTVVELGGQDAKVIFFAPDGSSVSDMRMNGVCAGGTGAFIDQMAALLHCLPEEFDGLAAQGRKIYEISGRCGVFAKTDIQPLLNQGASREDIALSCFHALAKQTIGGLAQGMNMEPAVLMAGGPFSFNPVLRRVFREQLGLDETDALLPEDPACFVALGAALAAGTALAEKGPEFTVEGLADLLSSPSGKTSGAMDVQSRSGAFFDSPRERQAFQDKYHRKPFEQKLPAPGKTVPVYIGLDAGSTTTKFVVTDRAGNPLYTFYRGNEGKPLDTAQAGLLELFDACKAAHCTLEVRGLGTTGYGEELFAAAFGADYHTVETIAHKEAACRYRPDVSFILDVGGQDMKAITVRNGIITNIVLNEACSAGCGSFIETYAKSLGVGAPAIADLAFEANRFPLLGSRCTVFMNSSIISEQKQGRSRAEILGGVCRSVVENLFTKVLRIADPAELGDSIVVQGGTFRNDAVLKAFVDMVGKDVTRPDLCGEMGAYGAALLALQRREHLYEAGQHAAPSRFIGHEGLRSFSYETLPASRCAKCSNQCELRMVRFPSGAIHTTGNRCERGLPEGARPGREQRDPAQGRHSGSQAQTTHQGPHLPTLPEIAGAVESLADRITGHSQPREVPDLWKERMRLLLHHSHLEPAKVKGSPDAPKTIGIPLVLDFYDSLPFWATFLSGLGCKVVLSGTSNPRVLEEGLQDISSDTICLPAKVVHGHIRRLVKKKVDRIFFPKMLKIMKEHADADDSWNCAVVQGYAEVVKVSMERKGEDAGVLLSPAFKWTNQVARRRQLIAFAKATFGVSILTIRKAFFLAEAAQKAFRLELRFAGTKALWDLKLHGKTGVVLAGRPYHSDPFVSHGISGILTSLGVPVLVNDALPRTRERFDSYSRMDTTNVFHSRIIAAAREVARHPELELVQLVSFGCGHDAVLTDELSRILREYGGKELLSLKIDEGENIGPLRIRIRSFIETIQSRKDTGAVHKPAKPPFPVPFRKEDKEGRTILVPVLSPSFSELMSHAFRKQGYRAEVLPAAGPEEVDLGKRYVHNDICYPAQINIGEILGFLKRNPDKSGVYAGGLAKSCNDCRAGQYAALARKAFDAAGHRDFPLITSDLKDSKNLHPGFKLNPVQFQLYMVKGFTLIDALDEMSRKIRPYEARSGETMEVFNRELGRVLDALDRGFGRALAALRHSVACFNSIPLDRTERRPRVGVIGEILVNFHERGNHGVVEYLEKNGMEVVLPALLEFWRQDVVNRDTDSDNSHVVFKGLNRFYGRVQEFLFGNAFRKVEEIMSGFRFYEKRPDIRELAELGKTVTDISFKTGEGWLMPAEILSWIQKGIKSFLIVQPFGCLPNHITGRGTMAAIKRQHPDVQILPLDFDPDTSEANIQNRLQMLILSARERERVANK